MRGKQPSQTSMLAFVDLDARVPPDHPLRRIKELADQALAALSLSSTPCTPKSAGPRFLPSGC